MVRTVAANLRTTYVPPETYPGPVRLVLVRDAKDDAANSRRNHEKAAAGWRRLAPELVAWRGPGNHMTIFEPPHGATLVGWSAEDKAQGRWLLGLLSHHLTIDHTPRTAGAYRFSTNPWQRPTMLPVRAAGIPPKRSTLTSISSRPTTPS
jgi:hypothetical protein